MSWCQQPGMSMAACANGGVRQSRSTGWRNVWTQWQNHLFTAASTVRSSARSPSATPGKTQLCVNVGAPVLFHFDRPTRERPWSLGTPPILSDILSAQTETFQMSELPWQKIALWVFSSCMLWASWHSEVGPGWEFPLLTASVTGAAAQNVEQFWCGLLC